MIVCHPCVGRDPEIYHLYIMDSRFRGNDKGL